MASREDRPGRWTSDPPEGSPTGGHLTPDLNTGPLFDQLDAPLPSEIARAERERERAELERQRTAPGVSTRVEAPTQPVRRSRAARRRATGPRVRPAIRRTKKTLKRVAPLSILKLSLFFYSFFLLVWLLFVAIVYWVVQSLGTFTALEEIGEAFVLWDNVDISLRLVEFWALIIGVIGVIVGSIVNAFLAFLYNVGADVVGGVEMTYVERDL